MDVARIHAPGDADARAEEYSAAAAADPHDHEVREIASGFQELARGHDLLSLSAVFRDVPRFPDGLPKLAIARADRRRVRVQAFLGRFVFDASFNQHRGPRLRGGVVEVDSPVAQFFGRAGYAIVPIVPPEYRRRRDLSRHYILWEVERAWSYESTMAQPDRDPLLLRRVRTLPGHPVSDLFAIIAEWDLSPLEQDVMARHRRYA
jgi:hypothetical protein